MAARDRVIEIFIKSKLWIIRTFYERYKGSIFHMKKYSALANDDRKVDHQTMLFSLTSYTQAYAPFAYAQAREKRLRSCLFVTRPRKRERKKRESIYFPSRNLTKLEERKMAQDYYRAKSGLERGFIRS